jgi:hypothetical protein
MSFFGGFLYKSPSNLVNPTLTGTLTGASGSQILMPNGSVGAPSYAFSNSTSSGMYWTGSSVGIPSGGVGSFNVSSSSISSGGGIQVIAGGVLTAQAGANFNPVTTITSTGGTVTGSDVVVPVDPSGGATAITLTLATADRYVIFMNVTNSTNTITITPSSGTINGAASITMTTAYQQRRVWFNGTNYFSS